MRAAAAAAAVSPNQTSPPVSLEGLQESPAAKLRSLLLPFFVCVLVRDPCEIHRVVGVQLWESAH